MIKVLTYINTALFVVGISGLGYGYLNKDKIVNTIVDKALTVVKESMPSMPTTTGLPKL